MFEDLVDDVKRVLGEDHPNTLTTRGNLAGLIGSTGRVQEAITLYEDVLDDMCRVLGGRSPHHANDPAETSTILAPSAIS